MVAACLSVGGCVSNSANGPAADAGSTLDASSGPGSDASTLDGGSPGDASPFDATPPGEDAGAAIATATGVCVSDAGVPPGTAPQAIDFDTWPDGGAIAAGTLIQDQYPGVLFSSSACGGGTAFSNGEASSPPNFLVGNPGSFQPIVMDLAAPVSQVGVTLISVGASTVTATAYDTSLTTVVDSKSVSHPGTGNGDGAHDPITLAGAGIARVVFAITTAYPGDGYGIDDVTLP